MNGFVNILLNGAISILLVVTISYAVILNRKLRQLQSRQSDLVAILGRLDGALQTASVTVNALRESADAEDVELPVEEPPPSRIVRRPAATMNRVASPAPAPRPAPVQQVVSAPVHVQKAVPAPMQVQKAIPAPMPVQRAVPEATARPTAKKPKAVLRADTLADRVDVAQLRPADGRPLIVKASAARPAQGAVGHRSASDELMSVMRSLRKG
jgi:hypothetical protein